MNIGVLHDLFLKYFKECVGDPLVNAKHEAQYYCPHDDCETNDAANRSYGKLKLSVSFSKCIFKCWVCGYKGSLYTLAKKYFSQYDHKLFLAQYGNKQFKEESEKRDVITAEQLFNQLGNIFYISQDDNNRVVNYAIDERGLTREILSFYNCCYCYETKSYKDTLIVPSYDANKKLNYFIARKIYKAKTKYVKLSISPNDIVFNEYLINWSKPLIIVEGPIDYLKLHLYNRTMLLGSTLHKDSKLMQRIIEHKTPIVLLLDPDAQEKAKKISKQIQQWGIEVTNITHKLGDNEDVGSLSLQKIPELFL